MDFGSGEKKEKKGETISRRSSIKGWGEGLLDGVREFTGQNLFFHKIYTFKRGGKEAKEIEIKQNKEAQRRGVSLGKRTPHACP